MNQDFIQTRKEWMFPNNPEILLSGFFPDVGS